MKEVIGAVQQEEGFVEVKGRDQGLSRQRITLGSYGQKSRREKLKKQTKLKSPPIHLKQSQWSCKRRRANQKDALPKVTQQCRYRQTEWREQNPVQNVPKRITTPSAKLLEKEAAAKRII